MNIVLLEDDITLHNSIKESLELHNYKCFSFYDGESFLANFQNFSNALYILDVNVPHINGLELLKHILQYNPDAKVIIISADNTIDTIEKAYTNGCLDYLKKPFYIKELLFKIQQHTTMFPSLKEGERLTKKEQLLLELLIQNAPEFVSFEKIDLYVYQEEEMSMNALRALVKRLRQKLQNASIISIPKMGYKLKL